MDPDRLPTPAFASASIVVGGADPHTADTGDFGVTAGIGFAGIESPGIANQGIVNSDIDPQDMTEVGTAPCHWAGYPAYPEPERPAVTGWRLERIDRSNSRGRLDAAASRYPPALAATVLGHWRVSGIWPRLGS